MDRRDAYSTLPDGTPVLRTRLTGPASGVIRGAGNGVRDAGVGWRGRLQPRWIGSSRHDRPRSHGVIQRHIVRKARAEGSHRWGVVCGERGFSHNMCCMIAVGSKWNGLECHSPRPWERSESSLAGAGCLASLPERRILACLRSFRPAERNEGARARRHPTAGEAPFPLCRGRWRISVAEAKLRSEVQSV